MNQICVCSIVCLFIFKCKPGMNQLQMIIFKAINIYDNLFKYIHLKYKSLLSEDKMMQDMLH